MLLSLVIMGYVQDAISLREALHIVTSAAEKQGGWRALSFHSTRETTSTTSIGIMSLKLVGTVNFSYNTVHTSIRITNLSMRAVSISHALCASLLLFDTPYALARVHLGLPHEVINVTQSTYEPIYEPVTFTKQIAFNSTSTNLLTITEQCSASTPSLTIYSIIFPSPDASPIEVTAQSQVLTSYVPEMTWCVGPPIALLAVTGAPYLNATTTNYTTLIGETGSCETVYAPMTTIVCATTLTGLGSKVPITDCDQEVTFSTECGFTLETPTPITTGASLITPAPSVKRMFTYWFAPWQSLTAGDTPSDVGVKICTVLDEGGLECIRYQEVWEVIVVTRTFITTRSVELTATVSGPGTLIIETLHQIITDTIETIDISTTLLLETEIETESTSTGRKSPMASNGLGDAVSTVFITETLVYKSTRCVQKPDKGNKQHLTIQFQQYPRAHDYHTLDFNHHRDWYNDSDKSAAQE
jgi:hypothetical protein